MPLSKPVVRWIDGWSSGLFFFLLGIFFFVAFSRLIGLPCAPAARHQKIPVVEEISMAPEEG
jgi:hypothetical protein